jgi:nickel-dependent lactate racemase
MNSIPFAGRDLPLKLPDGWRVAAELSPGEAPAVEDIPAALSSALNHPIGTEELTHDDISGKKIVIAVDDISRPTPTYLFFGKLIDHLAERGARGEDILVLTALGVHRGMTRIEIDGKLGRDNIEGLRWLNHDSRDRSQNAFVGVTGRGTKVFLNRHLLEADLILCVGLLEPHPLLGFGGGLKMILPGLAGESTIAENHTQGVSPERFNYIGCRESPMRLDLEEAAGMLGKRIFIINVILNRECRICRFICGDPVVAHREGCGVAESINARQVDGKADIAIVASNPMNSDLRQGIKAIANAERSVRDGGLIMAFLECRNSVGDIKLPPKGSPVNHGTLRFMLRGLGSGRMMWLAEKLKKGAGVEERFLAHFSMQVARKNALFVYSERLQEGTGRRLGLFRQFRDIDTMMKAAAKNNGRKAKVYIYPFGGVTYPVLR